MKTILLCLLLAATPGTTSLKPAAKPVRTSLVISWTGDGNPSVAVCGKVHKNCKSTIDIHDNTANTTASVSVTSTSYTTSNSTHSFSIRTSGYDLNGVAFHSASEPVP